MKMIKPREGMEALRDFVFSPDNRKNILAVIIMVSVLLAADMIRGRISGDKYIVTEDGSLKGIIRSDADEYSEYPLKVEVRTGKETEKRDVDLIFEEKSDAAGDRSVKEDAGAELDARIDDLIEKITEKGGTRVMLPSTLGDGSPVRWEKRKDPLDPMIVLMAPFLIWVMYMGSKKKKQDREKERVSETLSSLPAFNDHIVMMIDSGLTMRDAFSRVAIGYRKLKEPNYFERKVMEAETEIVNGTDDMLSVITRLSDEIGIRDFSRIAAMIRDSQIKGTELSSHLRAESRVLWDMRKKEAEERGKMAETKMTLPLAVLLMILILITAAPAIIQVQGG